MSDDLDYVRARIPDYRAYGEEAARHDSDMRVRAFVGERLTEAQTRLAGTLDAATTARIEEVLLRCMFTDQVFVRTFEHAELAPPMIAALVSADRALVELGERLRAATAAELPELLNEIDRQFDYRRAPVPVVT